MLTAKLPESQTKLFMQKLLSDSAFDAFACRSAMVSSFARLELSGAPDRDESGETAQKPVYNPWSTLRPFVAQFVRGGGRPKGMKLVFALGADEMESRFPEASALFLNIHFDGAVTLTTGTSRRSFSLDKSLDHAWETHIQAFLTANNITYEME